VTDLPDIFADLAAEGADIDAMITPLTEAEWASPTPAPGWTVKHQIGHLIYIFGAAGLSASDPEAFKAMAAKVGANFDAAVNAALADYLDLPTGALLERWRQQRAGTIKALAAVPRDQVVPWLVRPLPPTILASAGYMEMFAHGQDVRDALGVWREPTDRIGHLFGFAMLTWDFGYQARGLATPDVQLRFELTAPSGATWAYGPEDAENRITGSAHDFCLLVVRRRHRDDLDLTATGAEADRWMDIAQAYRGPAGEGRKPGQFTHIKAVV
jgi:uncharacterized protein (TIGR03084 family)